MNVCWILRKMDYVDDYSIIVAASKPSENKKRSDTWQMIFRKPTNGWNRQPTMHEAVRSKVRNQNESFLAAYCLQFMRLALICQTMNESASSILFIFNSAYCLRISNYVFSLRAKKPHTFVARITQDSCSKKKVVTVLI